MVFRVESGRLAKVDCPQGMKVRSWSKGMKSTILRSVLVVKERWKSTVQNDIVLVTDMIERERSQTTENG